MPAARSALAALAALALPLAARAAPDTAPLLDERAVAALAIALAVSPAPQLAPGGASDDAGGAALELAATVRARSISFDEVPRVRVSLAGAGPLRVRWTTERVNLPERIEPGAVYRDVEIRLRLEGTPEQVEALLADARRVAEGVRIAKDEPASGVTAVPVPAAPPAAAPVPVVAAPAPAPAAAAPVAAAPAPPPAAAVPVTAPPAAPPPASPPPAAAAVPAPPPAAASAPAPEPVAR